MLPFTADSGRDAVLGIVAYTIAGPALLLQVDVVLKMEAELAHGPIVPHRPAHPSRGTGYRHQSSWHCVVSSLPRMGH